MTEDLSTKTIDNPNPFEKECQAIFNMAIDHAVSVVVDNYIAGHSVVTPVLDKIIKSLNSLKNK